MTAKIANTFHRLSGYVLFPLLLITAHLGGAWSTWVTSHSQPVVRFVGYTLAPIVAIFAIYARVRLVDLPCRACACLTTSIAEYPKRNSSDILDQVLIKFF
jgi:hypothetical protein